MIFNLKLNPECTIQSYISLSDIGISVLCVCVCDCVCVHAWMRACSGTSVLRSVQCVLAGRQEIGHACGLPISTTGGMS